MSYAWYYVDEAQQSGPVSLDQLRGFLRSPRGGKNTLVWRKGFSDWRPAGELVELSPAFDGGPPPLPNRTPPLPVIPASVEPEPPPVITDRQIASPKPIASPKKVGAGRRALGIGAAIIGALLGLLAVRVFGAMLIWPAALIGITWLLLLRCNVEPVAVPMLAVVIGHTGWMIVGHVYLYAVGALTAEHISGVLDVAVVFGLTIWFFIRPSRPAAIGVLVYQCLALSSAIAFSGEISIPGIGGQALATGQWLHFLLRAAGIAFAIYAIAKLGQKLPSAASPVST